MNRVIGILCLVVAGGMILVPMVLAYGLVVACKILLFAITVSVLIVVGVHLMVES